jgi:hypothetical protein
MYLEPRRKNSECNLLKKCSRMANAILFHLQKCISTNHSFLQPKSVKCVAKLFPWESKILSLFPSWDAIKMAELGKDPSDNIIIIRFINNLQHWKKCCNSLSHYLCRDTYNYHSSFIVFLNFIFRNESFIEKCW